MDEPSTARTEHRPLAGFVHWFLVGGDRLAVSLVVLLAVGAAFLVAGLAGIASVTMPRRVMWYLNGTVNGLLTLIPITVGVNQIVLSHEFGSIQDLRDRRTDITEFRERVEELTDTTVVSPHASSFFGTVLASISEAASALQALDSHPGIDEGTRAEIESYGRSVAAQADRVYDELESDGTNMLRTLLVVLAYDDSGQYHETRRLQARLSDGDADPPAELDRLNELFVELDAARQFLKTVVVERQLARLSRLLVYTGLPAVTVAAVAIFSYRDIAGLTVPHPLLVVIAGTIVVTTLVPLVILAAYVLRVATIARQTASYGSFVPENDG